MTCPTAVPAVLSARAWPTRSTGWSIGAATADVPPFRRMALETSGLADPAPILYTLSADAYLEAVAAARPRS